MSVRLMQCDGCGIYHPFNDGKWNMNNAPLLEAAKRDGWTWTGTGKELTDKHWCAKCQPANSGAKSDDPTIEAPKVG